LHNCPGGDNPACLNPAHLWVGTIDDNQKDSMRKGRRPTGERHGLRVHPEACLRGEAHSQARLSTEDVVRIRAYGKQGYPQKQIAAAFGLSPSHIGSILQGKRWKHVPLDTPVEGLLTLGINQRHGVRGRYHGQAKLTEADVRGIWQLRGHKSWSTLARMYGVSKSTIALIYAGKIWKHVMEESIKREGT
jgi:DNA invertase Pin-like site-specific DNA recombinase